MAPNWDDEFDFDDATAKQAAKKPKQIKKQKKEDDDFFDLDDVEPPKASKLPVITQKTKQPISISQPKGKPVQPSKNTYDDYEEIQDDIQENKSEKKIVNQKSQPKTNYYDEEIEDEKPAIVKKQESKQNLISVKKIEDEEEYYEELEEEKPAKKDIKKNQSTKSPASYQPQPQHQQEYAEEEFDEYGEDFEQEVAEAKPLKKQQPKKSQTTVNLKAKERSAKQPEKQKTSQKKLVINTNKMFTNKQSKQKQVKNPPVVPKPPHKQNLNKPQLSKQNITVKYEPKGLVKSASRKSIQSNDSRKVNSNSRVSVNKKTIDLPTHKHVQKVEKHFPENEQKISQYGNDKLNRLNQQVRDMIRQFNEQLNELINKNMILLKQKPIQKKANTEEKVRVLEQQLKSGGTALEVIQNELQRLKGRQGELREQQYQLIMQKKIQDMKQVIKQTQKQITKLKFQVNNEGNKLSKHQVQKKMAQQLHQIKIMLIQTKKEQQKNEYKLQKLEKMAEQLQSKNSDKEYELSQQVQTAKDKGIQINIKQPIKKKYDELKMKVMSLQNHKKVMDGLSKNKCEHLNHQIDQIRQIIKNTESQLTNLNQSIQYSQEQSKKLIRKAKQNPKVSQSLAQNLQKILKSIEDSQAINFYQIRTEGNNSQASQRPLKTSMYDNTNKQKPPMRNNSSKKQPTLSKQKHLEHSPASDQINLMKPNFMKKKEKHQSSPGTQQEHSKLSERIWRQEQQKKKKDEEEKQRRLVEQEKKRQQQQKRKEAQRAVQEDKKKPFNLKKNRMANIQSKEQTPEVSKVQKSQDISLKISPQQDIKQEEKPSLGPKFMRLNKKEKNNDTSKNDISINKPAEEIQKPLEQPPKIETKIVQQDQPSFVPKRFNLRNKIEKKDEGYTPTIQKIEKKEQPKEVKKQYTPNFNFKQEQPFKSPIEEPKKLQTENKLQVPQQKPRFNLRLRDRQKKQNKEDDYVPSKISETVDTKPKNEVNNIGGYNPYNKDINSQKPKKQQSNPYQPSLKTNQEKQIEKNPIKESTNKQLNININNSANNPYAPKSPINNPYAQNQKDQNVNNPYAPKDDLPKRQKQGPLRKNKLLNNKVPKQKFNIYDQAQDITQPQQHIPVNQPTPPPKQPAYNPAKTDELDLNAMLGIKKKQKIADLDDLLGDIKVDKKKDKKRNNDFFNDLQL